jgi:hypothetical protein
MARCHDRLAVAGEQMAKAGFESGILGRLRYTRGNQATLSPGRADGLRWSAGDLRW